MSEGRLQGKVAVIAGAGGAMGNAVAFAYVREGARLLLVARRPAPLETLATELRGAVPGAEVAVLGADLVTAAGANAMAAEAVERFGGLDVLYNNLGNSAFGSVRRTR